MGFLDDVEEFLSRTAAQIGYNSGSQSPSLALARGEPEAVSGRADQFSEMGNSRRGFHSGRPSCKLSEGHWP